jgi:hypothetical protein
VPADLDSVAHDLGELAFELSQLEPWRAFRRAAFTDR